MADAIQRQIVESDGVNVISQLLVSEYPEVQSLALRAFNNIAENGKLINNFFIVVRLINILIEITHTKVLGGDTVPNLVEILRGSEDLDDYARNTTIEILTTLSSNSNTPYPTLSALPSFLISYK